MNKKVSLTGYRKPSLPTPTQSPAKPPPPPSPLYRGGGGGGVLGLLHGPLVELLSEHEGAVPTVEDVELLVDRMERSDRKALYDRLALRFQNEKPADRDVEMWATSVYEAAVAALGAGGGGMPGPLIFRRLLGARSAWEPVESYLAATGFADMKVAERQSILRLLAKLLVERCQHLARRAKIPLGPKLIAHNTSDLAALVDQALPGYSRSGMLLRVAALMFKEGRHE